MIKTMPTHRNNILIDKIDEIIKSFSSTGTTCKLIYRSAIVMLSKQYGKYLPYMEYYNNNSKITEGVKLLFNNYEGYRNFICFLKSSYFNIDFKQESDYVIFTKYLVKVDVIVNPLTINKLIPNFYEIQKLHQLYGDLSVIFHIYVMKNNTDINNICLQKQEILPSTILAEYIPQIDTYCIEKHEYKKPYLTLQEVILSIRILTNKDNILPYDQNLMKDNKHLYKILFKNQSMFSLTPLSFKTYHLKNNDNEICTICMDDIKLECYKTLCGHYFHLDCIADFIKKYYEDMLLCNLVEKELVLEYDINGNVIRGATYEYSCPNCKNPCFRIECERKDNGEVVIKNEENCIIDNNTTELKKKRRRSSTELLNVLFKFVESYNRVPKSKESFMGLDIGGFWYRVKKGTNQYLFDNIIIKNNILMNDI